MYLIVADDLTGGNDAGVQFAKHGMNACLALSGGCVANAVTGAGKQRVLVVNTNTRNLPPANAADHVASIVSTLKNTLPDQPALTFKKIDSTLRGNPGAEMDAIMDGYDFTASFFAPAYPQQGRAVVNGELFVNGTPLHQTAFADDPLTPIKESSIGSVLRQQTCRKIGFVPLEAVRGGAESVLGHVRNLLGSGVECIIFDAENAEHLKTIASAGLAMENHPLFIGSAGLAEALAFQLVQDFPASSGADAQEALSRTDRVFFICGSAHSATHAQTELLAKAGIPVIRLSEKVLEAVDASGATTAAVIDALGKGAAALASPLARLGHAGSMVESMALNASISSVALAAMQRFAGDPRSTALVVTGGETAYTVLEQIGSCLGLHTELLPGIVLCTVKCGPWCGLKVITKAGGFGEPETFLKLKDILMRRRNDAQRVL